MYFTTTKANQVNNSSFLVSYFLFLNSLTRVGLNYKIPILMTM